MCLVLHLFGIALVDCDFVQLVQSLFQHKAKMISLLDPHTHTYKIAEQADHVADAEVTLHVSRKIP